MRFSISSVEDWQDYDLVIACCGYESRSRSLIDRARFSAGRRLAIGYAEREVLAFSENKKTFERSGFEFHAVSDVDFAAFMREVIASLSGHEIPKVLLDISCFTRSRLAQIVEMISAHGGFVLDAYYSLAEFSPPPRSEPHNEFLCPVSSFFAGWTGEAERAVGLVCGLGYEQLKALGIIEYIDPFETWLFFPESKIELYDHAVEDANSLLLREVSPSNVVRYPVMDGAVIMRQLLALVGAVREEYRCILMPLGPKVFAFAAFLTGAVFRDVSVWRASSGRFAEPRDRQSSSEFSLFRVACLPSLDVDLTLDDI